MTSMNPAAHPVWRGSSALERLRRLAGATVSATSKEGTVKMSLTGSRLTVRLHPERIVRMPAARLADEVVSAFGGVLRGRQAAETKILARPAQRPAVDDTLRERMRAEVRTAEATASDSRDIVTATWRGADGVRVTIGRIATRPSDREWLETAIAEALERVNREYRNALRAVMRRVQREAR